MDNRIPVHAGYYSYITAVTQAKGYDVVRLAEQDLGDLVELQDRVLGTLKDDEWLRANTDVMLKECLTSHVTLGARFDGQLVAAGILYDGGDTDESIKKYFTDDAEELERSINLKLVLALQEHRHKGLSRTLVELLEQQATAAGKSEIMCTIHPRNEASQSLFQLLGYVRCDDVTTSYGTRAVFARALPSPDKHWAR